MIVPYQVTSVKLASPLHEEGDPFIFYVKIEPSILAIPFRDIYPWPMSSVCEIENQSMGHRFLPRGRHELPMSPGLLGR